MIMDSLKLNWIGAAPKTRMTWVKDSDVFPVNSDYVVGSQGEYKYIKEYDKNGILLKNTQFYYGNLAKPTQVTGVDILDSDE
jgi:hypothetical protein